jgi:hypothetical protein
MRSEKAETRRIRTWYGVNAIATIGPGFVHRIGLGSLIIPHPPLVNFLLRQCLTEEARRTLTFAHEFSHVQTAPGVVLYAAAILGIAFARGSASLLKTILILISIQAAWECASESITICKDAQFYMQSYKKVSIVPRVMFWLLSGVLTMAGWLVAI